MKHADLEQILDTLKTENIVKQNATWNSIPFYHPKADVGEEAYEGRMGIHEVLPVTSAIKDLIMASGTIDQIEAQAKREGMLTMLEDGMYKASRGVTTIEEVLRVISE
jgi:type II secretory ATPase GspE/PulE/Tfp pilus assembly ATPase PilB-like protein